MRRKWIYITLPLLPFLILLNFVSVYPFIYGLFLSIHRVHLSWTVGWASFGGEFIGLENFLQVLTDYRIIPSLQWTFIYTFGSVGLELLIGLGLALLANRKIKGLTLIKSIILVPMMATPVLVGYMWKMILMPDIGIANYIISFFGMPPVAWLNYEWSARLLCILVNVWQYTPFSFMCLLAGLSALPKEPFEAAMVDGASRWKIFKFLTIPMLKPIIVIVLILRTLWAFGSYDVLYILTEGRPGLATYLLTYHIWMVSFRAYNIGWGAALGWISLAITFTIAIAFIRWLKTV